MNYDVQIDGVIRRGVSYAELVTLPIESETFVRRNNGAWLQAKDCAELTHILAREVEDENQCEDDEEYQYEDYHYEDSRIEDEDIEELPEVEDRIFIPTAEYFKCKQKRKAAIIGVCTLGLAGLTLMGIGNTWRSNLFAGTSFMSHEGMAFVFKCLSFCILTVLVAIPYLIYSVFALIYYSIRLSNLKR